MTETDMLITTIYLSLEGREKADKLAEELYPGRGNRRRSEIIDRLLRAAKTVNGTFLTADERDAEQEEDR